MFQLMRRPTKLTLREAIITLAGAVIEGGRGRIFEGVVVECLIILT